MLRTRRKFHFSLRSFISSAPALGGSPVCLLYHVNRIGDDPDVDLSKPRFHLLLVTLEELPMLGPILHVHDYPYQIVAEALSLVPPRERRQKVFPSPRDNW